MSKRHIFLIGTVLTLVRIGPLRAQQGGTPGGEYYIHGIYNPTIADVQKIDRRPEPVDTLLVDRPPTYTVVNATMPIVPKADSIAPVRLNVVQANERLYHGFVKLGYGLYNSPLGELYYDQTRSKKNGYGIHLKHFSSQGGINDVGPSDLSFNAADLFYKAVVQRHEILGRGMYDRQRVGYYGYDPIGFDTLDLPEPSAKDIRQVYNDIGFGLRVRSLYSDSSMIGHDVRVEAHHYTNATGSRETNLTIAADLSKQQRTETYEAGILIDNNVYHGVPEGDDPEFDMNGTLVGLIPGVSTVGKRYRVRVGAGIYVDALGKTTFHFFPQVYASYSFFDNILVPYVGADGARERNSLRSLTRENPWTIAAPELANTSKLYDIFGGIRGSFSANIGFDVRVSTSSWKDRVLFVTDGYYSHGNQFTIVYDKVNVLDVSGDATYDDGSGTRIHARLDIFSYHMQDQAEPWNLPPYQLTVGAQYSLREKLVLKLDARLMGARKAFSPVFSSVLDDAPSSAETVDLKGFFDLYLGVEYRFTKRLTVFLDASNLSASKYERWFRYPVQRTLVIFGASYSF
ncbi:MAG: hypothetical protein H6595_09405 [Flavobacteriales bacterium]|nr:hypothetical protein [Flavobacteriales bacterium]MCB9167680.1 hypothetical protein [Flavobacteriales bacterium]